MTDNTSTIRDLNREIENIAEPSCIIGSVSSSHSPGSGDATSSVPKFSSPDGKSLTTSSVENRHNPNSINGNVDSQQVTTNVVLDVPQELNSTEANSHDEPMEGLQDDNNEEFFMVPPVLAQIPAAPITELCLPNRPTDAMNLELKFALHRFFTFPSNWSSSISRELLANSGFFLTLEKNAIQCYFCKIILSDSQISECITFGDDKHIEFCPNCPLMKGIDEINIPIYDPTNYRFEANRLYSLLTTRTPWSAPVTQYDLAKFGFYWSGFCDACRCTFCRLEVRGWEVGDTAESEHRRWNPNCPFIRGRSVGNVKIGQENEIGQEINSGIGNDVAGSNSHASSFSINPFAKSEWSSYGQICYMQKNGRRAPIETLGVIPRNTARHRNYISMTSRLDSYKTWPKYMPQRPEQLAAAGFYYTGCGDRVICFQCGGGLKDWASIDTPWCEHAKWFSRCPYLLLKKGKAYVDAVHLEHKVEMPIEALLEAVKNTLNNRDDEMEVKEEKVEQQYSSGTLVCRLCGLKDIETVLLPCGHMVTCMDCVEKEKNCHTCKNPYTAYLHIFLQ